MPEASRDYVQPTRLKTDLDRLNRYTMVIRMEAAVTAPLTACNVIVAAAGWIPGLSTLLLGPRDAFVLGGIGASVLVLLLHLDFLRRRGELLFNELTDELHWRVGSKRKKANESHPPGARKARSSSRMKKASARTALREFARAARLPFVYGWRGPAVYALVNLAATFLGLIGMRLVP